MEFNRADVSSNQLPHGTRVFIRTKGGRKVKGTVRWAGEHPLEGENSKKKIPTSIWSRNSKFSCDNVYYYYFLFFIFKNYI